MSLCDSSLRLFKVYLENKETSRRVRMRTKDCSYDQSSGTNLINVFYPGTNSGLYNLVVEHANQGEISESQEQVIVGPQITSVGPMEGSLYGSTRVVVRGRNFESGNIVYFNWQKCKIASLNETTIQCDSPATFKRNSTGDYIEAKADVYMRDSDRKLITCPQGMNCTFSWKESLTPEITNISLADGNLTCTGRNFPENIEEIEVRIGGRRQRVRRVKNAQEFTCQILEYESASEDLELEVITRRGGRCRMRSGARTIRAPRARLRGISIPRASRGGCRMRVFGQNFAQDSDLELIDDSGIVICGSLKYLNLRTLECQIPSGDRVRRRCRLRRKNRVPNETDIECQGQDCTFETDQAATPRVTVSVNGGKVGRTDRFKLQGSGFNTTQGNPEVQVGSKNASSTRLVSTTQIEIEFIEGVGFPQEVLPKVTFPNGNKAIVENTANITVPIGSVNSPGGVISSIRGGEEYYFEGNMVGLDKHLEVKVCGLKCLRDSSKESQNKLVCSLSALDSVNSVRKAPSSVTKGNLFNLNSVNLYNSHSDEGALAFDGDTSTGFGSKEGCFIGIQTSSLQRMNIQSIRYYLDEDADNGSFVGAKFEGSVDGQTWETISTIRAPPLQNWNNVDDQCSNFGFKPYRYFKFSPSPQHPSQCGLSELQIFGQIMFSMESQEFNCNAVLYAEGQNRMQEVARMNNAITYSVSRTPKVRSTSHRYISWRGGQDLIIKGENLGTVKTNVEVKIDGISCNVTSVNETQITCKTGERRSLVSPATFVVRIEGRGLSELNGNMVKYVCKFSDEDCWNGDEAPGSGDSLYIPPGLNLVIDVDSVPDMTDAEPDDLPYLTAVVVEGSLIFEPDANETHNRTFAANYIIVREGSIEIGTEDRPYTSNLEIVLYGNKTDPQLPLFGNKVIGVWEGSLDIHGKPRSQTWSTMNATVNANQTEITVNMKASQSNWKRGDQIVIAPTDFNFGEAEKRIISNVKSSPHSEPLVVLELNEKLLYGHYSGHSSIGSDETLTLQGEVGLLSHSVKIRGDDSSNSTKYGGHVMLKGNMVKARISNVEFYNVGQAYQLERHPLTFTESEHLANSYVANSSIWDGFNRAVALHASNCLKIEKNVAFNVMGHNFFLQDGAEINNRFIDNLAVATASSYSLLNTDQTPASFWISHPNNYFKGNHAAGAEMYGFWYDLHDHPTGSSETTDICPQYERMGLFEGNTAHSNGRYGVRIYETYIPSTYPCKTRFQTPAQNSTNPETQAYSLNPPVPALFNQILVYKNTRSGIIADRIGAIQFKDVTTADNIGSGLEITLPGDAPIASGFVDGALIVGFSENSGNTTLYETTKGLVTGQRDSFTFRNIKFRNFNSSSNSDIAAIGTCSHCSVTLDNNGFADTFKLEGLSFLNVTRRLKYHPTRLTILHNPDGTLADLNKDIYITAAYPHLRNYCLYDSSLDNSVVCSLPIRKLSFKAFQPNQQTAMIPLKIAVQDQGVKINSTIPSANYSAMEPQSSYNQWDVPFLVNQTYRLHWGNVIDWNQMTIKRSRLYNESDPYFLLQFNHTDRRDEFKVKSRREISNITIEGSTQKTQPFGQHFHYVSEKMFEVLVNARAFDAGLGPDSTLSISTVRCSGGCFVQPGSGPLQTRKRFWSVASDWDIDGIAGKVPEAGDKVIIPGGWNMFYDIPQNESVPLESLSILGRLTFHDPAVGPEGPRIFELKSYLILVEVGQFFIGSESEPYQNQAVVTLLGTPSSPRHGYSNSAIAGNKLLFVTGHFTAVGKDILGGGKYSTRLIKPCTPQTKILEVEAGLNWKPGGSIALAPSGYDGTAHQNFTIVSYDNNSGRLEINEKIQASHYGWKDKETESGFEYDLRAEVAYLSRNIVVQGDGDRWGGQIVVAQWYNSVIQTTYAGKMSLKYVELRYMAQYGTLNAAIRLLHAQRNPLSITYCSIHHLEGLGAYSFKANKLTFSHNVIYKTKRNGALIRGSSDLLFEDNLFIGNQEREWNSRTSLKDYQVAVDVCVGEVDLKCKNITVQRNIVAGGKGVGFTAAAADCNDEAASSNSFKDNAAHSVEVGLISTLNSTITSQYCGLVKSFTAHHCTQAGVLSRFNFKEVVAKGLVMIDNKVGVELGLANGDNPTGSITLKDSLILGEHSPSVDCNAQTDDVEKTGMVTASAISNTLGLPFSIPNNFHDGGGIATRGKQMVVENVIFTNFTERKCGTAVPPKALSLHQESADLILPHSFKQVKLVNITDANLLHLLKPDPDWAQLTKCGDFPCTGRNNVLLKFIGQLSQIGGNITLPVWKDFSIISNNPEVIDSNCVSKVEWNAAICPSLDWALVQFESLDSDRLDRSVQPIFVNSENQLAYFKNKLNSFMDSTKGFYESQKRMSRFSSLVRTKQENFFIIDYTGTPPRNQIFELHGLTSPSDFVKLRIDFTQPRAVRVFLNGKEQTQNPLVNGSMAPLSGNKCGENRWDPLNAILEFTILGGADICSLELKTLQSIQLGMRLQMSLDDFYSNDKDLTFLQKLAMQLNISKDRIKIVGVREGSVVLNVVITEDSTLLDSTISASELTILASVLQAQVNNGTLEVGATLLDFEMSLSLYSQSISPPPQSSSQKSSTDLIWPITIMVSSACVVIGAALFLAVFLRKARMGRQRAKVGVVSQGGELFKRVWPESLDSSVSGMTSSSSASDSHLRQKGLRIEKKIGASAFKTKVEDI